MEQILSTLVIVIPALNCASSLDRMLESISRIARDAGWPIVVADGGSTDATVTVAKRHEARIVSAEPGRGVQLSAGAGAAISDLQAEWLFFLHADSIPDPGWQETLAAFIRKPENIACAAYGRFELDHDTPAARRLEAMVAWRCRWLGLPYGDQGLLIHGDLYLSVGGFTPMDLMEDVSIVRRIGRHRLIGLPTGITTSASRYRRDGYIRRPLRNLTCLALYMMGAAPPLIRRLYYR